MSFRIGAVILLAASHRGRHRTLLGALWLSQIGTGPPLSGMSLAHPFGVDQLGRDVFSRVDPWQPYRHPAVAVGHACSASSSARSLGLLSGYVGGWIDEILQRLLEALISIPFLVLALIAIAAAGPEPVRQSAAARPGRRAGLCAAHRPHGARRGNRHRRRATSSRSRGCAARAPGRSCGASCCPMPPACCWSNSRCAPAMRRC